MIQSSRYLRLSTPNMQGPDVIALQRRLVTLGYLSEWNGIFDTRTEQAVRKFQQDRNLHSDGIVGPHTWTSLGLGNIEFGGSPYYISVDTQQNILSLFQNGRHIKTYSVATGKPSTPTPVGDWMIIEKTENPGGPFGARWNRLSIPNGGYAIHGTDNPQSIGFSVTHGCIRMNQDDLIELYDRAPLGTIVTITGRSITTRILFRGVSRGDDILELQRMLQVLGFYKGDVDGAYGPSTESAVRAFQTSQQMVADGIVGPRTANAIQSRYDIALGDVQP
ncbi:MAG: ErfK/YbiS/YcfS/YnhG family protein [Bacilli bacterium]|nr:ErfK/YbiS/YcfS/YnhG family protein [Bacilli bacterium]